MKRVLPVIIALMTFIFSQTVFTQDKPANNKSGKKTEKVAGVKKDAGKSGACEKGKKSEKKEGKNKDKCCMDKKCCDKCTGEKCDGKCCDKCAECKKACAAECAKDSTAKCESKKLKSN